MKLRRKENKTSREKILLYSSKLEHKQNKNKLKKNSGGLKMLE